MKNFVFRVNSALKPFKKTLGLVLLMLVLATNSITAQSFNQSSLKLGDFSSIGRGTSLMFGPDGRLYVVGISGEVNIFTIQKNGPSDYEVIASEELLEVNQIPNHNDDGTNTATPDREATGLTVAGTAENPIIYVASSDPRIGGPSGDKNLDTNSGIITRFSWNGSSWDAVDLIRGLPRSEENHATNGMEFINVNGTDFLIVCSGGHANGGGPSKNFAWTTEYALSAAMLSINLTMLDAMPILDDGGRQYIYDIPTLDDPTRPNVNGITDPDANGYNGIDIGDPWGGNDGLNQAMLIVDGPVQIFSPGYRNSYDLVITQDGKVFNTDNGANGGWGGPPANEGLDGTVTNDYNISFDQDGNLVEIGSSSPTADGEQVNNLDHLTMITDDIQNYLFGSFYGGHPTPVRANLDAGLFTNPLDIYDPDIAVFRTLIYDPTGLKGEGYTNDPNIALPANWPPVPVANPIEGDWRGPGINNPDGDDDVLVTVWGTNTNGIDEYTSTIFVGEESMVGDLIAGKNNGILRRVELNPDGSLEKLTNTFFSNLGGNALGVTCNSDFDPFPGTIWVATFNSTIRVLEPDPTIDCIASDDEDFDPTADYDGDGYSNSDELENNSAGLLGESVLGEDEVICNGGVQPNDFDKAAGGVLVSDLNDEDDDNDGILDANDPFQLGEPLDSGSDAFELPVINELLSDQQDLKGYLGLGFTGFMNNGSGNGNWLNWLDRRDDPNDPNPNDLLGGAIGGITMQMTAGTALGNLNNQEKGLQYGVNVSEATGAFTVETSLFNFTEPLQLYGNQAPSNGEFGFFIGDGTQSNYIKMVINPSGIEVLQELNDTTFGTPLQVAIPSGSRPQGNAIFRLDVDPVAGTIVASYSLEGANFETAGVLVAEGAILAAIQNTNTPLAVGLIGTSNESGVELEATWDYLNVQAGVPTVQQGFPALSSFVNDQDLVYNLDEFFNDNGGDENLSYSIASNTAPAITTVISTNILTLSFPSTAANGVITVRATDENGLFVEQALLVDVEDIPTPILRIRANGATISATDDGPDWISAGDAGAQTGNSNGFDFSVNVGNLSTHDIAGRDESVPDYVPQAIFASERWDPGTAPEMEWTFDLNEGDYLVRLYMGNGWDGSSEAGERIFNILMENEVVESNLDLSDRFGHDVGGMIQYQVSVTDGSLNILFEHFAGADNPTVNGIEILGLGTDFLPPIQVEPIADQNNFEDSIITIPVLATGGSSNENFSFSAQGLPTGLQIEPTTGLIFGTIEVGAAVNSPYTASITISKTTSLPVTVNFSWVVNDLQSLNQWNDQTDDEAYTARHECSFVQAGDRFYLFGGRENPTTLDVYDYGTKSWSQISDSAPSEFNHFQATEYNGLIWVIGAFKTNGPFPNEVPADFVWAYNPSTDAWVQGPEIPDDRKRGSAGLVVYKDKFYVVAGNNDGHDGGYGNWFDEFDPATGEWTQLPDAPRARDHFHSAVIGDKMYVAGGRLSGGDGGIFAPLIAEVDVYDFTTQTWSQVSEIPTPRAGASVGVLEGELYVIGGEIENTLDGTLINDAVDVTEVYSPSTNTWSTKASLITERHGTQAIVSGNGIHITAGSNTKGGSGRMRNMEFYGIDSPSGEVLTEGELEVAASLGVPLGGSNELFLSHVSGNTGILISNIQITGPNADDFSIGEQPTFGLIAPGTSDTIRVDNSGTTESQSAIMTISYDGNRSAVVNLSTGAIYQVLYRVNTGGNLVPANDTDNIDWTADQAVTNINGSATTGTPSQYLNLTSPAEDITFGVAFTGTNNTAYPDDLFSTERYSSIANPNNMQWDFPVANGNYIVNLIFAEVWIGAQEPGIRVFDVQIEGNEVLTDFDQTVAYNWNTTGVESFNVTVTDGNLDIDFIQGVENPNIKAIEILSENLVPLEDVVPIELLSQITNQVNVEADTPLDILVTASGGDGQLFFSATGLPIGLTINSNTGVIEGTIAQGTSLGGPNDDGDHFVTVTIDDADTVSDDALTFNFSWIIEPTDQTALPVIVVPETQAGVEGAQVTLQIEASGNTDCGDLQYAAEGLPPTLTINPLTGEITGTLTEGSGNGVAGAFIESNGLIMIEAETDFVNTPGGWEETTENGINSLSATSNHLENTNGETVNYNLQISNPGVYRFHMKSSFTGTNPTEENDTWFKIENTSDVHFFCVEGGDLTNSQEFLDELVDSGSSSKILYYPRGNAQGRLDFGSENPGSDGFFKVYRTGRGGNKWDGQTIDRNVFPVYAYFSEAGTFTLSMSERSAGHNVDRIAFAHIDLVSPGEPVALLDNTPQSQQNFDVTVGAAQNSPYEVTVTVTDVCDPQGSNTAEFDWIVSLPQTGVASAEVKVGAGSALDASTFTNGTFQVTNTGDIDIVSVAIDLSTTFMPDIVWDPVGTAGDNAAKCLEVNSEGGTGYIVPVDNCSDPFSQFHNGVNLNDGYDIATLLFTDFNSGETFTFATDTDPTSIKNDITAGSAGSISGLELVGSSVTITFADGTTFRNYLFEEGSLGGSQVILNDKLLNAPSITLEGVVTPATVSNMEQELLVQGTPNANVVIMQIDSRLYIDAGATGGPYDIDPFEANEAVAKELYTLELDGSGNGSIPVSLLLTTTTDAGPDAGINHFIAVEVDGAVTGPTSNVLVVEYDPNSTLGQLEIKYSLQGRDNHDIDLLIEVYDELAGAGDDPLFIFSPTNGTNSAEAGLAAIAGIQQGAYQITVRVSNYLQVVEPITIIAGTNSINVGQLLAGDANGDNLVDEADFTIVSAAFNTNLDDPNFDARADFNGDGLVSLADFTLLSSNFDVLGENLSN